MNPVMDVDPTGWMSVAAVTANMSTLLSLTAINSISKTTLLAYTTFHISKAIISYTLLAVYGGATGMAEKGYSIDQITDACANAIDGIGKAGIINEIRRLGTRVYFVFEDLTEHIYRFNSEVLEGNRNWHILTYEPRGAYDRRKAVQKRNPDIVNDNKIWNRLWSFLIPISMDEFPFASTEEGGAKAHARSVPARENSMQGGYLKALYLHMYEGQKFGVVPVPKLGQLIT